MLRVCVIGMGPIGCLHARIYQEDPGMQILYFASYVVIDPGETILSKKQLLTEPEYREYRCLLYTSRCV